MAIAQDNVTFLKILTTDPKVWEDNSYLYTLELILIPILLPMSEPQSTPVSAQEVEQVIRDLEEYRERLVNDVLGLARKVKFSQKQALEKLANHPEIIKIDEALKELRASQS